MPIFVDGTEINSLFVDGVRQQTAYADGVLVFSDTVPAGSQVFLISGDFIVPEGVTLVHVCIAGGGGGGGGDFSHGGGGGGGSGAITVDRVVVPGATIPVVVGAGGAYAFAGENSTFDVDLIAQGGGGADSNTLPGIGVNGGGDGGTGQIVGVGSNGLPCSATCDGSTNNGGLGAGDSPVTGGGGAGGFGDGADGQTEALPNTSAGGGGGGNGNNGRPGGSGKCIVSWDEQ